jgi:hypothetical protein
VRNPAIVEMENTSAGMASDGVASIDSDRGDIATLAYQLWNDRGCPIGSPDEDWFRAENELKGSNTQRRQRAKYSECCREAREEAFMFADNRA